VLERLGISPQSISLDNRLALIKSANDPPALLNLVRTLGVLNEAATNTQISPHNAKNLSNPAATGAQTQVPAQNESQAQPLPASIAPLQSSSPPAGPGFGSTSPAGGAASSSADQAALASNAAAQFQELQAVFQDAGNRQIQSSAAGSEAPHTTRHHSASESEAVSEAVPKSQIATYLHRTMLYYYHREKAISQAASLMILIIKG
jgi:hypothetical protein